MMQRADKRPPTSPRLTLHAMSLRHSDDLACALELEARQPRKQTPLVAVADAAQEVRCPARSGEELEIDGVVVEARHRSTVQAKGSGCEHEVGALKAAVPERGRRGYCRIGEPSGSGGIVREQLWELIGEAAIAGDDDACRRGQDLAAVRLGRMLA